MIESIGIKTQDVILKPFLFWANIVTVIELQIESFILCLIT